MEAAQQHVNEAKLLMEKYETARYENNRSEMSRIREALRLHFDRQGELISGLTKIRDVEAERLIEMMKWQNSSFMDLLMTNENSLPIQDSDGDLSLADGEYQPVQSRFASKRTFMSNELVREFAWSLIPCLVLCCVFAMFCSIALK